MAEKEIKRSAGSRSQAEKRARFSYPVIFAVLGLLCVAMAAPAGLWSDWFGGGGAGGQVATAGMLPAGSGTSHTTRPIEQIRVGDRVVAGNPQLSEAERIEADPIDPAQWRKIALDLAKPDGTHLDVELLRPVEWVEVMEARVGAAVYLDLPELGAEGEAEVVSIARCPAVGPGAGQVVTGTYAHQRGEVLDLYVEGSSDPIGVTSTHPFWSEDRQDFVAAGDLRVGERLSSLSGSPRVVKVQQRPGIHRVYNLEVNVEHVYCVSAQGLLVHNKCGASSIILGETMSRVEYAAKRLTAQYYHGLQLGGHVPLRVRNSWLWAHNKAWLKRQVEAGKRVFSLGLHIGRKKRSIYFRAEEAYLRRCGFRKVQRGYIYIGGKKTQLFEWIR